MEGEVSRVGLAAETFGEGLELVDGVVQRGVTKSTGTMQDARFFCSDNGQLSQPNLWLFGGRRRKIDRSSVAWQLV